MKVKKIGLLLLFSWMFLSAYSQEQKINHLTTFDDKRVHFGFTLGLNTMDFAVSHFNPVGTNPALQDYLPDGDVTADDYVRTDVATLVPGFTVGIVSSLRVGRDIDLRFLPGLSFGERQLIYNTPIIDQETNAQMPYYSMKSTFLDFPLLIKYKARRINNDRPYLVFGPAVRYDISRSGQDDLVRLKSEGIYFEIGAGWDHYFTFFRFSVEGKVSLGLNNQLGAPPGENQRQYYSGAIRNLKSNLFTLCFHFE